MFIIKKAPWQWVQLPSNRWWLNVVAIEDLQVTTLNEVYSKNRLDRSVPVRSATALGRHEGEKASFSVRRHPFVAYYEYERCSYLWPNKCVVLVGGRCTHYCCVNGSSGDYQHKLLHAASWSCNIIIQNTDRIIIPLPKTWSCRCSHRHWALAALCPTR